MLSLRIHDTATKADYRSFVRALRHAEAADLTAKTKKSYLLNSCIRGDLKRSLQNKTRFYPDFTRTYLHHLEASLNDVQLFQSTVGRRNRRGVTAAEELAVLLRICSKEHEGVFRTMSTALALVEQVETDCS